LPLIIPNTLFAMMNRNSKERRYVRFLACLIPSRKARRQFRARYLMVDSGPPPRFIAKAHNTLIRLLAFFVLPRAKRREFRKAHLMNYTAAAFPEYRGCSRLRVLLMRMRAKLFKDKKQRRVLVILHLFYMDAWPEIKRYLLTLLPYETDFIITYTGNYDKAVLDSVKRFSKRTKLVRYENRGYDIGPFIDVLQYVDLDRYDVVYKLHSKGIRRKSIFVYNQLFKWRDWFENLFNGLFGICRTGKVIDLLTNASNKVGLVAADNLIIVDPKHKQHFCKAAADKLGLELKPDYHFVAGSCFAVRAHLLKQVQALRIKIHDFSVTERGKFSFAHAMERLVCAIVENQGYEFAGLNVRSRRCYKPEVEKLLKTSPLRLLDDSRIRLDDEFFYSFLEMRRVQKYEIVQIALGDINRYWKGKFYKLWEVSPYKYLDGDNEAYRNYCEVNQKVSPASPQMSVERYEALRRSIEKNDFDERYMPVIDRQNGILDGQHRSCLLLHKYGREHLVTVLRLYY